MCHTLATQTKTKDMELQQAKEALSGAKTVQEWNTIRETLKESVTLSVINSIDVSGYITEVREANEWPKKVRR